MSKEKNPSDNDLRDVTVEVPRHKKHRRETEPSGRHKHRREAELSGVKVDSGRHSQCRGAEPNDMKKNAIRPKQRRESELGVVDTHKTSRQAAPTGVKVVGDRHKQRRNTHTADAAPYDEAKRSKKISRRSNDYAFDNNAFDGSLNNVNETRNIRIHVPPTGFVHSLTNYRLLLAIRNQIPKNYSDWFININNHC